MKFTLQAFLQFFQDLPFAQIGTAVAAGGLNVPIDVAAGEAIAAAAVKDFFTSSPAAPAVTTAPATTAAVQAHVASVGP